MDRHEVRRMAKIFNAIVGLDIALTGDNRNDLPGYQRHLKKEMMFNKSMLPLVFVFLVVGTVILVFRSFLNGKGVDWQVLSGGNLFIYAVTIVSLHLLSRGLNAENTHSFLRNAYSGILLKLMACAVAAFIYILSAGKNINKPAIFLMMGLYLVYSFVEMSIIMKQSKRSKHG